MIIRYFDDTSSLPPSLLPSFLPPFNFSKMLTSIIYHCQPTKTATFSLCFLLLYLFYCVLSRFPPPCHTHPCYSHCHHFYLFLQFFNHLAIDLLYFPLYPCPYRLLFSFYLQTHTCERLCPSVQMLVSWYVGPLVRSD